MCQVGEISTMVLLLSRVSCGIARIGEEMVKKPASVGVEPLRGRAVMDISL